MKSFILIALFVPLVLGLGRSGNHGNVRITNEQSYGLGGRQRVIMPGAFMPQDVSNLDLNGVYEETSMEALILRAANKAVDEMNNIKTEGFSSNAMPLSLQRIVSASTQVIQGMKYDMVMKILIDGQADQCHLLIANVNPWMNGGTWSFEAIGDNNPCVRFIPEGTVMDHRIHKRSAHLLGGDMEMDANADVVQKAAHFAMNHINSMSNSLYMQAVMKIEKATRQVIRGYRYRFQMITSETECRNSPENRQKTLSDCPLSNGGLFQMCDVSVILGVSDEEFTMETFKCQPTNKKPLIGKDDHDYKPHEPAKPLLGGDDHDYKPHGAVKSILGGDDHDYKPHGAVKSILSSYKPKAAAKPMLNEIDDDYVLNAEDYLPKRPYLHKSRSVESKSLFYGKGPKHEDFVKHMEIGGDIHDFLPHVAKDRCHEHIGTFKMFKEAHDKEYESVEEEVKRFHIFCENMEKVKGYQKQEQGTATYGATIFADMSEAEFKHTYLGFRPETTSIVWPKAEIPNADIPDNFDWRDHGAVTPVKNQGSCGSCWAFSTTGNIEGQYAIKSPNHTLYSLSEQELVDCDKLDDGCSGGLPSNAYEALIKLGGIETEKEYKYDGHDEKCQFKKADVVVQLTGAVNISQDEKEMAQWLYKNGPISIGINANAMQFYMGGIAHPWKIFCNPKSLDHGVLIVGYGVEKGEPYWIVKNSWGPSWGRKGYYYVYRGDGTCGLNTMCTSAVVKTK